MNNPELFTKQFLELLPFKQFSEEVISEMKSNRPQSCCNKKEGEMHRIAGTNVLQHDIILMSENEVLINERLDLRALEYIIQISGEKNMSLKRLRDVIYTHILIKQQGNV